MRIAEGSLVRWSDQAIDGMVDTGRLFQLEQDACVSQRWLGASYCWVPPSVNVNRPLWSVVSSRMGRHPHRRRHWFQMLERAIESATQSNAQLLICRGTAAEPWVRHAGKLYRIDSVEVVVADWGDDMDRWIRDAQCLSAADTILISPPRCAIGLPTEIPRRDVTAVALASRVFAPLVSPGGNIEGLLHRRLADAASKPASVWVAVDPSNPRPQALIDAGAVGWLSTKSPGADDDHNVDPSVHWFTLQQLLDSRGQSSDDDQWVYLSHCTRERSGPWPNQSNEAYRDELMLTLRCEPDSGPLASLIRIVTNQRIEATSRVTRGKTPVVCFSSRPLPTLLRDRTYRSHLGRWDYEPYGIAIRVDALQALGAREVIYGDEAAFLAMDESSRPFFQSQGSRTDWKQEQEWRVLGTVDLKGIDPQDAFVFVSTVDEAQQIARKSRWPIVVIHV